MKKIVTYIFIITSLFIITGCSGNKMYECKYTKKDTDRQTISKIDVEVDSKGKPIYYHYTYGFSNLGNKNGKYKTMCDDLETVKKNKKVTAHKDSVSIETVCNEKNNYQVYMIVKYDLAKLKGDKDFSEIVKNIQKYTKKDGTFDKDSWKESFNKDYKKGKYKCDF